MDKLWIKCVIGAAIMLVVGIWGMRFLMEAGMTLPVYIVGGSVALGSLWHWAYHQDKKRNEERDEAVARLREAQSELQRMKGG